MTRSVDERELCHERLGEDFATALSEYDTRRRLDVLIDDFLGGEPIEGREALDVGCGLGFFSERLAQRGAQVTACDLGANLVECTRQRVGCKACVADALALEEHFGAESFDLVVSSECIEHTPSPQRAVEQMCRVLRPGGLLALSTPNVVWWPVVAAATALRLRPFNGYENFSSWRALRRQLQSNGLEIVRETGLHLFPFQLGCHGVSSWCDGNLQAMRPLMINICLLARKQPPRP